MSNIIRMELPTAPTFAVREQLEALVEHIIGYLDDLDSDVDREPDEDLEPSLGGGTYGDDRELDPSEMGEPEDWL